MKLINFLSFIIPIFLISSNIPTGNPEVMKSNYNVINHANTLYVDNEGDDGYYTSIQAAIDDSVSGDTIMVYSGLYDEYVNTTGKSLNIIGIDNEWKWGNDTGKPLIAPTTNPSYGQGTVYIISDHVNFSGFQVDAILSGKPILLDNVKNCKISDNYLLNDPIAVYNSDYNLIEGNVFDPYISSLLGCIEIVHSNNTDVRYNVMKFSTNNGGTGVSLFNSSKNNVLYNTVSKTNSGFKLYESHYNNISSNTVQFNAGRGFWISKSGSNIFEENRCVSDFQNSGYGFYIEDHCTLNYIISNEIFYQKNDGIYIDDYCYWTYIIGNNINRNLRNGIYCTMYVYLTSIIDNIMFNNSDYGVYYLSLNPVFIKNNNISRHGFSGIYIESSDGNIIDDNDIYNNFRGVDLMYSDDNDIIRNRINENEEFGILLWFCFENDINSNYIISSAKHAVGISLRGSQLNLIYNNSFRNLHNA